MYSLFGLEVPIVSEERVSTDKIIKDNYFKVLSYNLSENEYIYAETKEKTLSKHISNRQISEINSFDSENNFFMNLDYLFYNKSSINSLTYSFSKSKPSFFLFKLFGNLYNTSVNFINDMLGKIPKTLFQLTSNKSNEQFSSLLIKNEDLIQEEKYKLNLGIIGDLLCVTTKSGKILFLNLKNRSKYQL